MYSNILSLPFLFLGYNFLHLLINTFFKQFEPLWFKDDYNEFIEIPQIYEKITKRIIDDVDIDFKEVAWNVCIYIGFSNVIISSK
jgi:hypothetical protein